MKRCYQIFTILAVYVLFNSSAMAEKMDSYYIYGKASTERPRVSFRFPDWFKNSFYDLNEDLKDARDAGKRGIMIVFSQENCSHCLAFIKATLGDTEVRKRLSKNYDVIGLDIFNDLEVTDIDGSVTPIKDFAVKHHARWTPTIMFYGVENIRLAKFVGFYPPEKFQSVLDYIDDGHYRTTKLSQYLRETKSSKVALATESSTMKSDPLFIKDILDLQNLRKTQKRPTLVLFEKPNCNACKRFHERVMKYKQVRAEMEKFNVVQLDATDDKTRMVTPGGRQLTPKRWFEELELSYDVASVFFDENGKEVLRNDAEVGRDRMKSATQYVLGKGYLEQSQLQRWRREQILKNIAENGKGSR